MTRFYIAALCVAFFIFAYLVGVRVGREKCVADIITAGQNTTNEIINRIGDIHENTLKTDTRDIRRVLRARYTIAE